MLLDQDKQSTNLQVSFMKQGTCVADVAVGRFVAILKFQFGYVIQVPPRPLNDSADYQCTRQHGKGNVRRPRGLGK